MTLMSPSLAAVSMLFVHGTVGRFADISDRVDGVCVGGDGACTKQDDDAAKIRAFQASRFAHTSRKGALTHLYTRNYIYSHTHTHTRTHECPVYVILKSSLYLSQKRIEKTDKKSPF